MTELARSLFRANLFDPLFRALVRYMDDAISLQTILKIFLVLCTVEKRTALLIRLHGGLPHLVTVNIGGRVVVWWWWSELTRASCR